MKAQLAYILTNRLDIPIVTAALYERLTQNVRTRQAKREA